MTGENSADGIWYLQDIFISLEKMNHTIGTAIYKDSYRRQDDGWKIARTTYERVIEVVRPLDPAAEITSHYLAKVGRKRHERTDISRMIVWD
jgi:hypothetical protein